MGATHVLELAVGCAVMLSCGCAWLTFYRTGRTSQAVQFGRLLREDPEYRKGKHAVANLQQQMKGVEARLSDVVTKADLERLAGELHVVGKTAERTEKTVDRLHEWLMERSA